MSDNDDGISNRTAMWIAGAAAFVSGLGLLLIIHAAGNGHITYDPSDSALYCIHQDQCERPGAGQPVLAELQNTLSNLAYLFFGACAIVRAFRRKLPLAERAGPLLFGISMCLLAACSAWYHATLNFDGTNDPSGALRINTANGTCGPSPGSDGAPQVWDVVGVYLVLFMLFAFGVSRVSSKSFGLVAGWRKGVALGVAIGLPVTVAALMFIVADPKSSDCGLALMIVLGVLALLASIAQVAEDKESTVLAWVFWGLCFLLAFGLSSYIKRSTEWDSTWVFAVMMVYLVLLLTVNWLLTDRPVPLAEGLLLLSVFVLGILPRLLDGYDWPAGAHGAVQKALCSPGGFPQAHALWHMLSALALALTFDMLEKSRQTGEDQDPGPMMLPEGNDFNLEVSGPYSGLSIGTVLVNVVFSAGATLMMAVVLANAKSAGAGFVILSLVPVAIAVLFWVLPAFASDKPQR